MMGDNMNDKRNMNYGLYCRIQRKRKLSYCCSISECSELSLIKIRWNRDKIRNVRDKMQHKGKMMLERRWCSSVQIMELLTRKVSAHSKHSKYLHICWVSINALACVINGRIAVRHAVMAQTAIRIENSFCSKRGIWTDFDRLRV